MRHIGDDLELEELPEDRETTRIVSFEAAAAELEAERLANARREAYRREGRRRLAIARQRMANETHARRPLPAVSVPPRSDAWVFLGSVLAGAFLAGLVAFCAVLASRIEPVLVTVGW